MDHEYPMGNTVAAGQQYQKNKAARATVLIVLPYCHKEVGAIKHLLTWTSELCGRMNNHRAVLLASSMVKASDISEIEKMAACVFAKVNTIKQRTADERGWPQSCNAMFRTAAAYVSDIAKTPFWWNECDCIPLKDHWLDLLEDEYYRAGKPFMGCVVREPFPHLTGCAAYPVNIGKYNPYMLSAADLAWDVMRPEYTIPHAHHTRLFHHDWGDAVNNIAPTFPDIWSVGNIKEEAAVFHRNKDGTLIKHLRELKRAGERPGIFTIRRNRAYWRKSWFRKAYEGLRIF